MTLVLPRLPPTQPDWGAFQIWWQQVVDAVEAHETIQDQLILDIQDAQKTANARMPDVSEITITADYTGTVDPADQLPKVVVFTRYDGLTDVSASALWSASETGGITGSIDAGTGVYTITAITTSGTITATSIHNGITLSRTINVFKTNALAPIEATTGGGGTGSGGSTATTSSFSPFNSTTAAAVTADMSVVVGAGGQVALTAPLDVTTSSFTPAGSYTVKGQWYWWDGASWVAQGSEATADPVAVFGLGEVEYGYISISANKSGLTPAATEKFRLYARNATGTETMSLYGTASAVSS